MLSMALANSVSSSKVTSPVCSKPKLYWVRDVVRVEREPDGRNSMPHYQGLDLAPHAQLNLPDYAASGVNPSRSSFRSSQSLYWHSPTAL